MFKIILIFSLSISVSLCREPNYKPVGALPVFHRPITESTVDEYTNPKVPDSSIDKDTSGAEGDSNKSSDKAIDEKSLTSAITSILDPTTVIDISKSIEYADNNTATELAKYDNLNVKYENIHSFMEKFDQVTLKLCKMSQEVLWNYVTDIADVDKKNNMIAVSAKEDKIKKLYWEILRNEFLSPLEVQPLNTTDTIYNETFSRKIKIIRERGTNVLMPQSKQREEIDSMQNIWSTARVCAFKDKHCKNEKNSKTMEDVSKLFTTNQDYDELLYYWHKWRDATGRKIRPLFRQYIDRVNNVSRSEGYKDAGDLWRFSFETEDFSGKVDELWTKIKPLYKLLHAYVGTKLSSFYEPNYEASDGMIPEHVLSNLWGQQWQHLYNIMVPYSQAPRVQIKNSMQTNNWTARSLFENVDQFYRSMGMIPMADSYGNKSILTKPENMVINCAPSSHDMCDGVNYRVKMCAELDEENLQTAARLLGHVQYYMQYKNQPYLFRDGPNPAFHDAIADLIGIQILSPKHLAFMNLTDDDESKEDKINFLMRMALEKLPLIGYAYVLDKWRWTIFENDTFENWNELWWDLRKELTMIDAPLMRNESDLDPASKYHVVSHVQYITYFVSYILEFQILRSLCIRTKQFNETSTDDDNLLMDCHLYGSAEAGDQLSAGMKLGASEDWKAVLRTITGEEELSADGILSYFQPLENFLKTEKKRVVKITEDMDQSAPITVGVILVILTLIIALVYCVKKKKYGSRISSAIGLSKNGSLDITNNVDSDKGKVNEAVDQISEDRV